MTHTNVLIRADTDTTEALADHHCHLRPAPGYVVNWILPEDGEELVPLGWETYPGLILRD